MEPPITIHDAIDHDGSSVHHWRASQLRRLGSPGPMAGADADRINWHQIAQLVQHGWPPQLGQLTTLLVAGWSDGQDH
jgi:hypothetical protein